MCVSFARQEGRVGRLASRRPSPLCLDIAKMCLHERKKRGNRETGSSERGARAHARQARDEPFFEGLKYSRRIELDQVNTEFCSCI